MIKVSVDPASIKRFQHRMQDFVEEAGKTTKEAMELLAKACAKELAITVPPFGLSAKIGAQFEKSIAKQINRAISAGNVSGKSGDAAQIHESYRNAKGQVPKGLKDRGQYKREPIAVREKQDLILRKQKSAGIAKGAWIAAGEKLNGKKITGVGRWVRRHAQQNGSASVIARGVGADVVLTNQVQFISNLHKSEYVEKALKRGYQRNFKHMTIVVKKIRKEI